jgi:hypothetical protein
MLASVAPSSASALAMSMLPSLRRSDRLNAFNFLAVSPFCAAG